MSTDDALASAFRQYSRTRLADCLSQVERCLSLLTVEQIWHRPNDVSNAIGNLVLHLRGNVGQWILAGVGGREFQRNRRREFAERGPLPVEALLPPLRDVVADAFEVIDAQSADRLLDAVRIQDYDVTRLAAIYHVVEHFSLHTGQIIYAAKALLGRNLDLYDAEGKRLDGRRAGVP